MSSGTFCMPTLRSRAATSSEAGLRAREVLQQVVEREAGVHDVLDQQHVAALEVVIEVLEDPHHAGGLRGGAVGRHRHEVELERQADVAGQVRHDHERALQHADQQQRCGPRSRWVIRSPSSASLAWISSAEIRTFSMSGS